MSKKYDVIVIGAGIGGLTAAAILARNGKKVLVLEKNPMPGGYAVNFRRGEFEFDTSLHLLDSCRPGNKMYRRFFHTGIAEKIKFVKPDYLYRSIFPNFDIRVPQQNLQAYLDILCEKFPEENKGIIKLFIEIEKICKAADKFIDSYAPLWLELIIFPFKYPKLFSYRNKTVKDVLDKFVKNSKLKAIISQLWCYYGLPPSKLSIIYFSYPTYNYLNYGGYHPKGGGRTLTKAFCEVIKQNSGEIRLNTEVSKIILEKNRSKGVRLSNGDEFFANSIISNIDARKTFFDLVGKQNLSKILVNKINRMGLSISGFQVYLGLNIDLKEQGIKDYEIFYSPSYDIEEQYNACIDKRVENEAISVTLVSNVDPDLAPKGKSVISITTLGGYDFWSNLSKEEYKIKKQEISKSIIKRVEEKIIPNLSSYIEKIEIATPLTMEKYTGSSKGAIYGWSEIISQSGMRRLHFKTPIKNLYLSSAWTWTGGGISSVVNAGYLTARHILKGRIRNV